MCHNLWMFLSKNIHYLGFNFKYCIFKMSERKRSPTVFVKTILQEWL